MWKFRREWRWVFEKQGSSYNSEKMKVPNVRNTKKDADAVPTLETLSTVPKRRRKNAQIYRDESLTNVCQML